MKKYSWYSIALILLSVSAMAQEVPFAWQSSIQPIRVVSGSGFPVYNMNDTYVDGNGNTYVTGYFRGTCDFDPSPAVSNLVSPSNSDEDAFFAKYDAAGNFVFAKNISDFGNARGLDITVTTDDKILVVGFFANAANFDPGVTDYTIGSNGLTDGFIATFDAITGSFETAYSIGGFGDDTIGRIIRSDTLTYISGSFTDAIDVDVTGAFSEITTPSGVQGFVACYNNSFSLYWAHGLISETGVYSTTTLGADASGPYLAGTFTGTVDFEPNAGDVSKTSVGGYDAWITHFDTFGDLVWNQTFGGTGEDRLLHMAVSASNLHVTGYFSGTIDLDPGAGVQNAVSAGAQDAYLSRLDLSGNLVWSRTWGGTLGDVSVSVGMLAGDQVLVAGNFQSASFDVDPGAGVTTLTNASAVSTDGYLAAFDSGGALVFGYSFGNTHASSTVFTETAVIRTNDGARFSMFGDYNGIIDLDPTTDVNGVSDVITGFQQGYLATYVVLANVPGAQPTGLVLSNETSGSIDVSFTSSGADGYLVLRRGAASAVGQPKDGKSFTVGSFIGNATVAYVGSGNSFTDVGLAAGSAYNYYVYAYSQGAQTGINYLTTSPLTGGTSTQTLVADLVSDSLALVALYNSTNGPTWTNSTNWLTGPISSWYGVTVVGNRVTTLILGGNAVTGTLPPAIGNLTALTDLQLWGNQIAGNIPPEIGNLVNLTYLDLAPNQFVGNIPPEIGNLTQLTTLWLNNNKLTGAIPVEMASLTQLAELYVSSNQLTGSIPPELGALTQLTTLDLSINQLTGAIPTALTTLTSLGSLNLSANQLTGTIPADLGLLTALTTLDLSQNQLDGQIPVELGGIIALQTLRLNSNRLEGSIPAELGTLSGLQVIDLGGNLLTGSVPTSLCSITTLQTLGLARNQLSGTFPSAITGASGLVNLWIDNNQFTGTFPAFTNATNPALLIVTLNVNNFDDLPDLSSLGSLSFFDASENNFTFEDFEPNLSLPISYDPQNEFSVPDTLVINSGDPLTISYLVGGSANSYLWRHNNIGDSTYLTNSLNIPAVVAANAGNWQLMVISSIVPNLTLYSGMTLVDVIAESVFTRVDAGDLTDDGANASMYGGVWGDYDNDGFEDLFTLGISDSLPGKLYHNNGNGTFSRTNAIDFADGRSGAWGDYNNDGFLDLFVPDGSFAVAQTDGTGDIYKNNGNGTFTRIPLPYLNPVSGSWVDLDRDGDLDLAVGGVEADEAIFRNDGNDVFVRVDLDINDNSQWNSVWADFDEDGDVDVVLPAPNSNINLVRLFMNEGVGDSCPTCQDFYDNSLPPLSGTPRGVSVADIDNDGDLDMYVMLTNGSPQNYFFINEDGYFNQELASTRLGDVLLGGRGSAFGDLNNDGYQDLITFQNKVLPYGWTIYLNNGDGTFTRETDQTFKTAGAFEGISLADYNNDGFLDAFSSTFTAGVTNGLYENVGNGNHWMKVTLHGTTSNHRGVTAAIHVKADGFWRYYQIIGNNGFSNQGSFTAHFGLGAVTTADSVVVRWPSGCQQVLTNVAGDATHVIQEPANPSSDTDFELVAHHQLSSQDAEGFIYPSSFVLDANDNMVMPGRFGGTVDFDPSAGTDIRNASGQYEEASYVAKYLSDGSLEWVHTYASDTSGLDFDDVALNANGDAYMATSVSGSIDADPGAGTTIISGGPNGEAPAIVKFLANGDFDWAKTFQGSASSGDLINTVIDAAGDLIVAGAFDGGNLDVDPGAGTAIITNGDTSSDTFIAKYDDAGNYQWSVQIGQTSDSERPVDLDTDSQRNIYLYIETYLSNDTEQITVQKYNASGSLIWSFDIGSGGNLDSDGAMKIDEANNRIFISGTFESVLDVNGTSGGTTLSGGPEGNGFVAWFDLNGAFQDAKAFRGSDYCSIMSIEVLEDGSILLGGGFEGTVDLDPGAGTYEPYGHDSYFTVKLSTTGDFIWAYAQTRSGGTYQRLANNGDLLAVIDFYPGPGNGDIDPSSGITPLTAIGEDLVILRFDILAGITAGDSLALQAFYNATGGPNWTNDSGWLSGDVDTWFGVTVVNDQITSISLPGNNLTGSVPDETLLLDDLETLNVSGNNLVGVPDFSPLPAVTNINISDNRLDFASLEPNVDVAGIVLNNQKPVIIGPDSVLVNSGDSYVLEAAIGGTANAYTWKRNGTNTNLSTSDTISIENISRANMGAYSLDITNSLVPGVTLTTVPVYVLATATLSGKLMMSSTLPASAGVTRLLRVTAENGYDTTRVQSIGNDGTFSFNNVVLDDYQIVGFADTLVTGQERALPTYYQSTIYWEEADTLFVEGSLANLNIISQLEPTEPLTDDGVIAGTVEEDDGLGGRGKGTKRVGGAGVSARRTQGTGKGKEILELVAYVYTNENGEFSIDGLPVGDYRINIQYPGYPMDEESFIDIPIGSSPLDEVVTVQATVAEGKITVVQLIVTGYESNEYKADVFPNPASSTVTVTFEEPSVGRTVKLIDMKGTKLANQPAEGLSVNVDVRNLAPGLYMMRVEESGSAVKTVRISVGE